MVIILGQIRSANFFCYTRFNSCVELVTDNKVKKIIKHLKHAKAPGHDGVTNSMIKQLPNHCINHMVVIYKNTFKLQQFPVFWKKVEVITIPKRGEDPKLGFHPQNI